MERADLYVGLKCKIEIHPEQDRNKRLFYTADVLDVDNTHIHFKDRYGELFSYPKTEIAHMKALRADNEVQT